MTLLTAKKKSHCITSFRISLVSNCVIVRLYPYTASMNWYRRPCSWAQLQSEDNCRAKAQSSLINPTQLTVTLSQSQRNHTLSQASSLNKDIANALMAYTTENSNHLQLPFLLNHCSDTTRLKVEHSITVWSPLLILLFVSLFHYPSPSCILSNRIRKHPRCPTPASPPRS